MAKSFSARLTRYIGIITSVLFIGVMLVFAIVSHKLIVEESINSVENLLSATTGTIEKTLGTVESCVKSNVWLIREHINDKKYLHHITTGIVESNPNITGSAVAFSQFYFNRTEFFSPFSYDSGNGGEVVKTFLGSDYDYFSKEWYKVPAETGQQHWSEPYFDENGSGRMICTYSYPIVDIYGMTIAVATADISLEWAGKLADSARPYPNSAFTLISPQGAYIGVDENGSLLKDTIISDSENASDPIVMEIASDILGRKGGTRIFRTSDGHKAFAVYGPMDNGWSASLVCDYRDVLERAARMNLMVIILGLMGLMILSAATYFIIRHLTRPLSKFSESAISIAGGNFNTRLPKIKSGDEIQQLSDSFDYMQRSLLDYMENLKATTAAKQRIDSELSIASSIQRSMLPKDFPKMEGIDLYAMMKPAKEVGGDLYDFHIAKNTAFFAIGDVSGKGVPAALFMAITRMAFHFASDITHDLGQRMSRINSILSSGNSTNMFATILICALDLETSELSYCNGGHNRAVIVHPDGKAEFLDQKPNLAVGIWPGFEYVMQKTTLEKGARILLYTDGVTEAERADKSQYGDDRLLNWARNSLASDSRTAEQDCMDLFEDVQRFTEGNEQNDDITIMTIKI